MTKRIENFKILKEHDKIKDIYAAENKYPLLRLKFSQYKYFKKLIDDFLKINLNLLYRDDNKNL